MKSETYPVKDPDNLLKIYEPSFPSFLLPFLSAPSLKRIQGTGMHCGMEYTSFPFYKDLAPYSRYIHSLGVALIVYHFTQDKKQSLAGLFHDIATPAFAHVIDFLKGDYAKQEATEEKTAYFIEKDPVIQKDLLDLGLKTEDVFDYHRYPIADNDSPRLSADRLEYTLANFLHFRFASLSTVKSFYEDLSLTKNEEGKEEICFQSQKKAHDFALLTLKNSIAYVRDEDRYGMEYLARLLEKAIQRGVLQENDLYTTEEEVIQKLNSDPLSASDFASFRSLSKIRKEKTPSSPFSYQINSKKRYINPFVKGRGRIQDIDEEVNQKIEEFLSLSFEGYLVKD